MPSPVCALQVRAALDTPAGAGLQGVLDVAFALGDLEPEELGPVDADTRLVKDRRPSLDERLGDTRPAIVTRLAEGWKKIEIARYLGLSPARVTQLMAGVADAYVAYLGTPGFEYRARKQEERKSGRMPRKSRAAA